MDVIGVAELLVRLEGAQELILDKLTELGVYKTRSEVIRAGILGLGKEYHLLKSARELEDELAARKMKKVSEEIKKGKRKVFTLAHVKAQYGFK